MIHITIVLMGINYLRARWFGLMFIGLLSVLCGAIVSIDALDNSLYFPLSFFAAILLIEGIATVLLALNDAGGQKTLRYIKGSSFIIAALLILAGHHEGNIVLSLVFGTLFLVDGLLQIISAHLVRYPAWRYVMFGGLVEIAVAISFYQPYPSNYEGTVPYFLGIALLFAGWNMIMLAYKVCRMSEQTTTAPSGTACSLQGPVDGANSGLGSDEARALVIHIWTPVGTSASAVVRQPITSRYIAAVDNNGVISTGHAALESPEGIYISLYPKDEIEHSPEAFIQLLRATCENNVPGRFLPDYHTESEEWCHSTVKVHIRNYDEQRLKLFWQQYQKDNTYNLTHRNCSSTVARALEAALAGASQRLYGHHGGWETFFKFLVRPELWIAVQIRRRAETMAWTPGLILDYARVLSILVDKQPSGSWLDTFRWSVRRMIELRQQWRRETPIQR
ncbi:uncharacterized membrane protein HdeD (DUF308 family) [Biostraticola tofi]|uniref:Uncharacterized membrane protein HdeD (DUF308 family) n=2 Tax=Biostraticola tofi TaxID=466109 RepID=A0A4R3Z472_9GAMM|nr:uncharacterized membrane protein HdeD (DUF308 family) [Biostraticola tofi]